MKKLLVIPLMLFAFHFGYSQKGPATGTSTTNYYHEGIRTGCGLATNYSKGGSEHYYQLYKKTISANFPSTYIAGVLEGWDNCYNPKKQLGNLGKIKRNPNGTYTVTTPR